jgi:hypothetical protein
MKTRLATLASTLAIAAVTATNGCTVDDRASVQVDAICAPTDDCTFAAQCDAQFIGFPTLDVTTSASDSLWVFLQVGNQRSNSANPDIGRVNTHDAHVDEIVMEYDGVALSRAVIGANFSVPASGSSVISAEVIPDAINAGGTLGVLAPTAEPREIVARVRLRGYYDDGDRFETGEFPITIRVCSGCLATSVCALPTDACPPGGNGQLPLACAN